MPTFASASTSMIVAALAAVASAARPAVMVNGLPGAMGREVAAACLRRGLELAPFGLTGLGCAGEIVVDDGIGGPPMTVRLYEGSRDELTRVMRTAYPAGGAKTLVCVDYTHPSAVNGNAEWYAANKLPFVMGTTGGDRDALMKTVSGVVSCVIAPNMAKQIVALQAAMQRLAADFPGAFDGYSLRVAESHQADWTDERIERVRDAAEQIAGGGTSHTGVSPVPEAALGGHAFHTYSMVSADAKVEFQIRHNVQGRSTYAEGTVDAVVFLGKALAGGGEPRVFNMIDVLEAGAM